jgi:hypothetical protein
MTVSLDTESCPVIPDDIARIVISPKSYTDDELIYGTFRWLRENMPLAKAHVPGFDPIWIVTKHADIREAERNAKLFRNSDFNPVLNDRASDEFTRSINGGSTKIISSLTYMDGEHGIRIAAMAQLEARRRLGHPFDHAVEHRALDIEARGCEADLSGIEEHRQRSPHGRRVEVGIGKDQRGRLAAQFQRDALQVPSGGLDDLLAHARRSGEGDLCRYRDARPAPAPLRGRSRSRH